MLHWKWKLTALTMIFRSKKLDMMTLSVFVFRANKTHNHFATDVYFSLCLFATTAIKSRKPVEIYYVTCCLLENKMQCAQGTIWSSKLLDTCVDGIAVCLHRAMLSRFMPYLVMNWHYAIGQCQLYRTKYIGCECGCGWWRCIGRANKIWTERYENWRASVISSGCLQSNKCACVVCV